MTINEMLGANHHNALLIFNKRKIFYMEQNRYHILSVQNQTPKFVHLFILYNMYGKPKTPHMQIPHISFIVRSYAICIVIPWNICRDNLYWILTIYNLIFLLGTATTKSQAYASE